MRYPFNWLLALAAIGAATASQASEIVRVQPTAHPFAQSEPAKQPATVAHTETVLGRVEMPLFGLRAHYDEHGNFTMSCHVDRPTRFIAPPDAVGPHP